MLERVVHLVRLLDLLDLALIIKRKKPSGPD